MSLPIGLGPEGLGPEIRLDIERPEQAAPPRKPGLPHLPIASPTLRRGSTMPRRLHKRQQKTLQRVETTTFTAP